MSLSSAIELIRSELPEAVAVAIKLAVETSEILKEVAVPGFSLWHMKAPENVRHICERRLVNCETEAKEKWLREQIDFLDKSFAAATAHELWQAYCVTDSGRVSFMIDTGRCKFCMGPFP